jgi:alkylhydroperoxidase family enzyme
MSARSAVARQRGATEQMLDNVDNYEDSDLSLDQKAALRVADAFLTSPADMTETARAEVAAHLTQAQVVEVTLKIMGNASDKIMVALGLDFDEVRPFDV